MEAGTLMQTAPLTEWTERALTLIVTYRQNPLRAARSLCYLHAAIHDGLWIAQHLPDSMRTAIAHRAAGQTLAYLYPYEPLERQALVSHDAQLGPAADEAALRVFDAALDRAWRDGSEREWLPQALPRLGPGQWRPSPPLRIATPLEALGGEWLTWALADGEEPNVPAPLRGAAAAAEFDEVRRVRESLSDAQKAVAEYWNLDRGTVTPPGLWNRIALQMLREQQPERMIAALALLNVAMMDALIICWRIKYRWWTERPITAIHARGDRHFKPWLLTPPFPSFVSGHATVSGAAARVLGSLVPERRAELEAMAEEAAWSRLLGGIHTRHDNEAGLALGRAVAERIMANSLCT